MAFYGKDMRAKIMRFSVDNNGLDKGGSLGIFITTKFDH